MLDVSLRQHKKRGAIPPLGPRSSPLSCCVSKDVSPDISDIIRLSMSFISDEPVAALQFCDHADDRSSEGPCHRNQFKQSTLM